MKLKLLLFLFCSALLANAQQTDKKFKQILYKDKQLKTILKKAREYKIQIVYTPILADGSFGQTLFFHYDSSAYFYPASTVKLPASLFTLEKLKRLNIDRKASFSSVSDIEGYPSMEKAANETIESLITKILLVSDNDAFNRLYDFLGTDEFNQKLSEKGLNRSRINHRLSIALSQEKNQHTPEINVGNYKEAAKTSNIIYKAERPIPIAEKYYSGEELINEPMDFSSKNRFDLMDQQHVLKALFFPEHVPNNEHFDIRPEDLVFIKKMMSELPRNHGYDENRVKDGYTKFLGFGDGDNHVPDHLKIYNKIGGAYGFLIDNALFDDQKNKVKFLLSAVVYSNKDEILNDDKYDYDTIGYPFMGLLGRRMLAYTIENQTN